MISTTYDPDTDAMFIRFAAADVKSVRTEEISPSVMLDFADDGRMIAIEVWTCMNAWLRLPRRLEP